MISLSPTDDWRTAHPGGAVGILEMSELNNRQGSATLDARKRETEGVLRSRYGGCTRSELLNLPVLAAYAGYYKRFDKTYHVLLQLESIALKGKNLPNVSPLVDANFVAEVESLVLTAGHDADRLSNPVVIDNSSEGESMVQMNGESKEIRPGDMVMRDASGISCSIIYGQDNRSPITAETTHALYVAYAPPGVTAEEVGKQLHAIEDNIRLFCPDAVVEQRTIIPA